MRKITHRYCTHTTNKIPLISLPHDVRFSFCEATARQYAKYVIYISVREVLVKFYSAGTGLQMHTGGMALVFVAKKHVFRTFWDTLVRSHCQIWRSRWERVAQRVFAPWCPDGRTTLSSDPIARHSPNETTVVEHRINSG